MGKRCIFSTLNSIGSLLRLERIEKNKTKQKKFKILPRRRKKMLKSKRKSKKELATKNTPIF
jgi:hypothetical protein